MQKSSRERQPRGTWVVIAAAALWAVSLVTLLIISPSGVALSSDPGAEAVPYWVPLLPSAVGIALVLLIPRRSPIRPAVVKEKRPFVITTAVMIVCAIAFPVASAMIPLEGEFYILGKLILFIVLPGVVLLAVRRSVKISWQRDATRWWAPAIVIVVWTIVSQVAPWNPTFDIAGLDRGFVVLAAVATALTAGVGEEVFYRRWLQTRLEAGLGGWPGIVVASLAFALMHLGSHGSGDLVVGVARVIVVQGTFGLFLGIMWWRYRNLWALILVHVIANGWAVAAALVAE